MGNKGRISAIYCERLRHDWHTWAREKYSKFYTPPHFDWEISKKKIGKFFDNFDGLLGNLTVFNSPIMKKKPCTWWDIWESLFLRSRAAQNLFRKLLFVPAFIYFCPRYPAINVVLMYDDWLKKNEMWNNLLNCTYFFFASC